MSPGTISRTPVVFAASCAHDAGERFAIDDSQCLDANHRRLREQLFAAARSAQETKCEVT
ncbi:hypothetical protein [Mesorhizobium sp.]|uniref:hypothetical protein n=1 Tax=Mesorhizobium sp. TaxID=1871066 RepID=UPI0025EB014C|nr:hypothetical protein [Mesorhizobium sp.]